MSLFQKDSPSLQLLHPSAAIPGGEVNVIGRGLEPSQWTAPQVFLGDTPARVALSRPDRLVLRVPSGSVSGDVTVAPAANGRTPAVSNGLPLLVGVPIAENLFTVSNPVADSDGNIYVAYSGERGQATPHSVLKIDPEYNVTAHATGILNATGLALDDKKNLYVSSRHEGAIYRITPSGAKTVYAEGMGVATGLAFDEEGNLYCGDRSGTIFKIAPDRQIFVFATLEPSVAAFHLSMSPNGTLFAAAPTTSSYDNVYAISQDGNVRVYYSGLGRPQGMAITATGDLLIAASLRGARGVVAITPRGEASLAIAGPGIVGLTRLPDGNLVLATADTMYHLRQ